MIRCMGCLNESAEEFITHCRYNSDVVHIKVICILCGPLDLATLKPLSVEREATRPYSK